MAKDTTSQHNVVPILYFDQYRNRHFVLHVAIPIYFGSTLRPNRVSVLCLWIQEWASYPLGLSDPCAAAAQLQTGKRVRRLSSRAFGDRDSEAAFVSGLVVDGFQVCVSDDVLYADI